LKSPDASSSAKTALVTGRPALIYYNHSHLIFLLSSSSILPAHSFPSSPATTFQALAAHIDAMLQPSSMAKASEPNRNKSYDPKKTHITDTPMTKSNWWKHVNWLNVTLIVGIPIYGCVQAIWTPLRLNTAIFAVIYYFWTGLGITAGMFA
jgi:hypothetical protein